MQKFAIIFMFLQGCFRRNHCSVENVLDKLNVGIKMFDPVAKTVESFIRQHHRFPDVLEFEMEYKQINGDDYSYGKPSGPYKVKPWPFRGLNSSIFKFTYEENGCIFTCDYRTNPYYVHVQMSKYVTESDLQEAENRPKGWFCSVYNGPDTIHR